MHADIPSAEPAAEPSAEPSANLTIHDVNRDMAVATLALASVQPGTFVRCLQPMGQQAPAPPALLERLPAGTHQIALDLPNLVFVHLEAHQAVHQAWLDAATGTTRVAQVTVPMVGPIRAEDGTEAQAEFVYMTFIDLIGVSGIELIVVLCRPSNEPENERDDDPGAAFRLHMNRHGVIIEVAGDTAALCVEPDDLMGATGLSLIHPDDIERSLDDWMAVIDNPEQPRPTRVRLRRGDGTWRWFEAVNWNALSDPAVNAVVTELRNVDARVRAENLGLASSRAHDRLVHVLDEVDDIVMVGRTGAGLEYWNARAEEHLVGLRAGVPVIDLLDPSMRALVLSEVLPSLAAQRRWSGDMTLALRDGKWHTMAATVTPVIDPTMNDSYFGVILRDVTDQRRHEAELAAQARRDPLTGLPNRLALSERLASLTAADVGLCFIDLDNLKVVNDGLGHGAGDKLLVSVTETLQSAREGGTVYRFGGDEFVVVHTDLGSIEATHELAGRLLESITAVRVPDIPTRLSASIGVSWTAVDDLDPESLIKDADTAMYDAKRRGRGQVARFDNEQREAVTRRFVMETALQQAIVAQEIEVHLQPVVSTEDGTIGGFEALARWSQASPAEFIPTAEESGLIIPLGAQILERALSHLRRLDDHLAESTAAGAVAPIPRAQMAVNISARELIEPSFAPRVLDLLDRFALAPRRLVLELTETVLIDSSDAVDETLRTLRDAGVSLVLDDFGTGYSSMAYLRRYPIDGLKLDNSYTRALLSQTDTRVIAEAIIALAHRLGISIVAEGVEHQTQLETLADLGVIWVQGFLLSPAVPVDQILGGGLGNLGTRLRQIPG